MDMRRVTLALSFVGLAGLGMATAAEGPQDQSADGPPKVSGEPPKAIFRGAFKAIKFDISPPLRDMVPGVASVPEEGEADKDRPFPSAGALGPQDVDKIVQTKIGPGEIPGPNLSWDGFSNMCGCSPPDSDGDVGPNHYIIMVNLHFAIYSKVGALMFGPVANNTLWTTFGGTCATHNSGDPVVLYDQLADRWILTQFTSSAPFANCLAVSTTADPLGTYFRYALPVPSNVLPDYPKWGVWPDAYYLSTREVSAGLIGAYAIDRAAVLAGNPAATIISFTVPGGAGGGATAGDGLLPTDLDGTQLPPAGSPNFFVGSMDNGGPYGAPQDALTFFKFHADFAVPANSTFGLTNTLPVDPVDTMFGTTSCTVSRMCIPQPTTGNLVDHLGYRQRPTFRLAYRNFTTHESLVTTQSVEAAPLISGMRWYEIRSPQTTPVIFQQGTFAPGVTDGVHRWMGSIAMDRAGNMLLGYSASNATTVFPSLRYTGRLVTDPPGQMPQGEGTIHAGTGSQTGSQRWGDYTAMTVDPADDCTFFYVNEYYPVNAGNTWRMRVGSSGFPAPQCIPVPVALQSFAIE
jgi:hypothetical protein